MMATTYVVQATLVADPDALWVNLVHPDGLPKENPSHEDLRIYRCFRWKPRNTATTPSPDTALPGSS
jgi:hypothetical protein